MKRITAAVLIVLASSLLTGMIKVYSDDPLERMEQKYAELSREYSYVSRKVDQLSDDILALKEENKKLNTRVSEFERRR